MLRILISVLFFGSSVSQAAVFSESEIFELKNVPNVTHRAYVIRLNSNSELVEQTSKDMALRNCSSKRSIFESRLSGKGHVVLLASTCRLKENGFGESFFETKVYFVK